MNKNRESTSSSSDDGYNSDNQSKQAQKYNIARDTALFKKNYQVVELLNNSANGVLYSGKIRSATISPNSFISGIEISTNKTVVIKQVPKIKINSYVNVDGRPVPKEFHIHRIASSIDGVVKAFEWFERRTSWVLVMDKPANCIDIFDFTSQYGTVTEECAVVIIGNIVKTCATMFSNGIFHRDIKDENVLLNPSNMETHVIDFGCATQTSSKQQMFRNFAGTPDYTAPEYFCTGVLDQEKSTIWNIGCLFYILLFGEVPFKSKDEIVSGQIEIVSLSKYY